ncbi:NXPE2-like protein, partial [Mya arenaria]
AIRCILSFLNRSAIFKAHIDDQDSKFEEDDFLPFPNLLKEEDTISDVQTNELDHVVSAEKSTITLLDRKEIYKLGDSIRVMIDLYDHAGHRKSSGGEMVRVILIGSDVPGTAVPGHVIDNGNGSYTAEIEALWTGKSRVSASLVYSRQSIAALYRMRRDMLSTRIIQAGQLGFAPVRMESPTTICRTSHGGATVFIRMRMTASFLAVKQLFSCACA